MIIKISIYINYIDLLLKWLWEKYAYDVYADRIPDSLLFC